MMIVEYYNNLRKKRAVFIITLAVMVLALAIVPLTAHAENGDIIIQPKDAESYMLEWTAFTFEVDGAVSYQWYFMHPQLTNSEFIAPTDMYIIDENTYFYRDSICERTGFEDFLMQGKGSTSDKFEFSFGEGMPVLEDDMVTDMYFRCAATLENGQTVQSDTVTLYQHSTKRPDTFAVKGGFLASAGQLIKYLITAMGQFIGFFTTNPVLFVFLLIVLGGTGIAFLARIMKS